MELCSVHHNNARAEVNELHTLSQEEDCFQLQFKTSVSQAGDTHKHSGLQTLRSEPLTKVDSAFGMRDRELRINS